MPSNGLDRWTWTLEELRRAVAWLRKHCGIEPITRADLTRCARHITERDGTVKSLRRALLRETLIRPDTSRGRRANYTLLLVALLAVP